MSLNYDFTKCEKPKDHEEEVTLDSLILATVAVGLSGITKENAAEFYARISFLENMNGQFRVRDGEGWPFRPEEIKRWIGLKTNVYPITRAQFLKRFDSSLNRMAHEYREAVKRAS